MSEESAGTFETRADAGEGGQGEYRLWKTALDLAAETEKKWRKKAQETIDRFRDEKERKAGRFNILFSSVQTQEPAIYNSTPQPDVRRRFNDPDPVGKIAAQAFERSLSHCIDDYDFDCPIKATVHDSLLPGRGVAMVVYNPALEGGYDSVTTEHVQWDDFRHGPGKKWSDVPWYAVRYRITREEAIALNPKLGPTVTLDYVEPNADKDNKDVPTIFKRLTVWKIWDKPTRKIKFLAESYKDGLFASEDDVLNLKDFFPFPRPLYDIEDSGSLVPLIPYEMYRDQAEELDRLTGRIRALVACLKWRGIRPAQIAELDALKDADDGDLIPSESANSWLQAVGSLDKAIWLMPIEKLITVIRELIVQREAVKQVVFEISGLADIMRGETDPNETLGAQQIKAQWGSLRMQRRQREVQRFVRDILRIKAEIIGEHFSTETLQAITGIQLPTPEMKMAAQAQAGMLAEQQQPVPEEIQAVLASPTWDDVKQIMSSDALRSFKVDIESDSTIQADLTRTQQNMAQFVEGLAAFGNAMGPLVQAKAIPMDTAVDILSAFARNFKLGRQAEDALDRLSEQGEQPQGPDPAMMQAEAENERAERELAMKERQLEADVALQQQKAEADITLQREKTAADIELQRVKASMDMEMRREESQRTGDFEREKFESTEEGKAGAAMRRSLESVVKTAEMAAKAARLAVEEVSALRAEMDAPRTINVQRVNGRIVGGVVERNGTEIPVTVQ